jgi:hypothetical protein
MKHFLVKVQLNCRVFTQKSEGCFVCSKHYCCIRHNPQHMSRQPTVQADKTFFFENEFEALHQPGIFENSVFWSLA